MTAPTPRGKLRFDRRIRLEFHGATITSTSDARLLACRELDDALGLTETASECLQESRGGRNVQHRLVGLSDDPTMRVVVGRRGGPERPAASTNTMSLSVPRRLFEGVLDRIGRLSPAPS